MKESWIKKVKSYNIWPPEERQAFIALLNSLDLDDKDVAHMVKPIEDSLHEESRKKFSECCWYLLGFLGLAALAAFLKVRTIPMHDEGQLGTVWLLMILACGVIFGCMYLLYRYYDVTQLIVDRKKLLYLRFIQEGALGGFLSEADARGGVTIYGQEAEEDAKTGMFSHVSTKVLALAMVLINVALGAVTVWGTMSHYQTGAFTATLVSWGNNVDPSGTVVIPAEYKGQPVTTIDKLAFENQTKVRKIVVPDTVKVIESGAFRGCTNLQEVVLPNTLEILGAEVFSGCRSLTSFTLPAGVTEIRADTFLNCSSLTEVKLHDGLTNIRAGAFSGCSSLTQISLPAGLKVIPARMFRQCKSLKTITIPASVIEIGAHAFESCTDLADVKFLSDMPGGKIGEGAFRGCDSLVRFDVPKGVTKLSAEAFYGCKSLQEVTLPPVLEENKISESLFQECRELRAIVIPEGVTRISAHAFQSCVKLSSVTVPKTLTSIGSSAFRDCRSLMTITLPKGCRTESNSFKYSPTRVGYFSDKPASTPTPKPAATATPKPTATATPKPAATATPKPDYSDRTTKYTIRGKEAVLESWGAVKDGTVEVPATYLGRPVVEIAEGAFSRRTDITKVVLPDTIKSIGKNAFYGCSQLMEINMPADLQEIKDGTFAFCAQLESVTLPDGIKKIGQNAFYGCRQLKDVTFPAGLKSIGQKAFAECPQLTHVSIPEACSARLAFDRRVTVEYFTPKQ